MSDEYEEIFGESVGWAADPEAAALGDQEEGVSFLARCSQFWVRLRCWLSPTERRARRESAWLQRFAIEPVSALADRIRHSNRREAERWTAEAIKLGASLAAAPAAAAMPATSVAPRPPWSQASPRALRLIEMLTQPLPPRPAAGNGHQRGVDGATVARMLTDARRPY